MAIPVNLKFHQTDFIGLGPDLDDLDSPGLYEFVDTDVRYYILVIKGADANIVQLRIRVSDAAAVTRSRVDGVWNNWYSMVDATNLILVDVPTEDPAVAGQVWSDAGVLTVSAGGGLGG